MTLNMMMLRAVVASVVGVAATVVATTAGGQPGAATCQRSVAIDPQVTVSEAGRSLTFVVYTGECAVAGALSFVVTDGTAQRQSDFYLENGDLSWAAGDLSSRTITATIIGDALPETPLEDFRVTLTNPSPGIRIASRYAQGRIFDNDTGSRLITVDRRICLVITGESGKVGCAPRPTGQLSITDIGIGTLEPGHIINVPLILNAANGTNQSASFNTSDGSLHEGYDFVSADGTVTIPQNALAVVVPVQLLTNAYTHPGGGYFNVALSSYSAGGVILGSAQVMVVH